MSKRPDWAAAMAQRGRTGMPTAAQKAGELAAAVERSRLVFERKRKVRGGPTSSLIERLKADLSDVDNLSNWPDLTAPQRKKLARAAGKMRSALTELIDLATTAPDER